MSWTAQQLESQSGKTFVITGANSGIGLQAAIVFATHGAKVVMACRSMDKAAVALERVKEAAPSADVSIVQLDLASLDAVKSAAQEVMERCDKIHGLINNAGIMAIPRNETADGFEMQLGTNHLGHFAWTAHLLPVVEASAGGVRGAARVVNVSSVAHRLGAKIDFDNLMGDKSYKRWQVYGQSKLANMLFTFELQRRLAAAGANTIAVACHPGYSGTNLQFKGAEMRKSFVRKVGFKFANGVMAQSAEKGAWPTVRAATDPTAVGGEYYGPQRLGEMRGPVGPARIAKAAKDETVAQRLWEVSESLTGVTFNFGAE